MKELQIVDLNITNAKVPTKEGNFVEAGISIESNRIYRIGKLSNLPKASKTIDAAGNIILPGLIDVHVHLRDLKQVYKEDFFTGTSAAAAGGFTTILDMPNTQPPANTPDRLREKIQRAKDRVMVNVGFYAAFPSRHEQFASMPKNGALAFKVFLHNPVTELDVNRDDILLQAFRHTNQLNLPVVVHAEDGEAIQRIEKTLRRSGKTSLDHYLKAHSSEMEVNAVKRIIKLAVQTGSHVHFCHISAAPSVEYLTGFRPQITCEVTPHHLLLTKAAPRALGGIALMNPPLRSRLDTSMLWRALNEGWIDIIASDHAPHTLEEKQRENIWEISPGIPGLETTLPLMLTQIDRGRISWGQLIQLLATKPAELFQLDRGSVQSGSVADLVIVDLNQEYKIDSSQFLSKAKYSPFDGWEVKGRPVKTFVGGQLVYDSGEIVEEPGSGTILRP